jgi:hypothetical protein
VLGVGIIGFGLGTLFAKYIDNMHSGYFDWVNNARIGNV